MAMRKDLAAAYLCLLGLSVLSLFFPVPVIIHMIASCVLIIYIGSHNVVLHSGEAAKEVETMDRSDVYMFPIIGSCVLFGLYLVYKFLPTFVITVFIKIYFLISGLYVVAKRAEQLLGLVLPPSVTESLTSVVHKIDLKGVNAALAPVVSKVRGVSEQVSKAAEPVVKAAGPFIEQLTALLGEKKSEEAEKKEDTPVGNADHLFPDTLDVNNLSAASFVIGTVIALLYITTNHWLFSNVFGICFSIQAIELINIGSYMNGVLLLAGLFVYDIFWVFGTDVMVTVATKFDAPIKLIYPSSPRPSMLGLGDIVIPGIFMAFMLKIDAKLNKPHTDLTTMPTNSIDKALAVIGNLSPYQYRAEYFNTVTISYALGLLATNFVLYTFKAAQPALLYLVPACLGATAGLALYRGKDEFNLVINFTEEEQPAEASTVTSNITSTEPKTVKSKKAE